MHSSIVLSPLLILDITRQEYRSDEYHLLEELPWRHWSWLALNYSINRSKQICI